MQPQTFSRLSTSWKEKASNNTQYGNAPTHQGTALIKAPVSPSDRQDAAAVFSTQRPIQKPNPRPIVHFRLRDSFPKCPKKSSRKWAIISSPSHKRVRLSSSPSRLCIPSKQYNKNPQTSERTFNTSDATHSLWLTASFIPSYGTQIARSFLPPRPATSSRSRPQHPPIQNDREHAPRRRPQAALAPAHQRTTQSRRIADASRARGAAGSPREPEATADRFENPAGRGPCCACEPAPHSSVDSAETREYPSLRQRRCR